MTNTLSAIALAFALLVGTASIGSMAFAGSDVNYSPFYPDKLRSHPNVPVPPQGGSGIPPLYR